ncbi:MAG: glucosamine-6-phosphate deaminase [Planctomycetota bacterium]|jgi:glucosamine-6-phosphate deaminase|nr:glucosamine-6-phosphate deaminase [Planctomycetota bacterium]
MGAYSAKLAAMILRSAIAEHGQARIIVATGSSQFEVLDALSSEPQIDWSCVDGFHLDEYVGIAADHRASFCGYLKSRFVDKIPLRSFHFLDGTGDPQVVCQQAALDLLKSPVDVALIGIGENGHLAFNDPPADFETTQAYHVVLLDEACRNQQVGEGWFASLQDVPTHAISMTIHQILQSKKIICSVPDERKALAVRDSVEGPTSNLVPGSILKRHPNTTLVLDRAAASLLKPL